MKRLILPAIAVLLGGTLVALAANTTLWSTTTGDIVFPFTNTTIGDAVNGGMAPVNAALSYTKAAPSTGFSLTFGNFQQEMVLRPSGTLTSGTVTMASTPVD